MSLIKDTRRIPQRPTGKIKLLGEKGRAATAPLTTTSVTPTTTEPSSSSANDKTTAQQKDKDIDTASVTGRSVKASSSDSDLSSLFHDIIQLDDMTLFHRDRKVDPKMKAEIQRLIKAGYELDAAIQRTNELAIIQATKEETRTSLDGAVTSTFQDFEDRNPNPFIIGLEGIHTGAGKVDSTPTSPAMEFSINPMAQSLPELPPKQRKFSIPSIPNILKRKTTE